MLEWKLTQVALQAAAQAASFLGVPRAIATGTTLECQQSERERIENSRVQQFNGRMDQSAWNEQ